MAHLKLILTSCLRRMMTCHSIVYYMQFIIMLKTFFMATLQPFELLDLYGVDLPSQLALLPSYDVRSKLHKIPNMTDFDMDENLAHTIN